MKPLKQTLIERDNLTEQEAEKRVDEVKQVLYNHIDNGDLDEAFNVCMNELGLEPDYIMDLI